MFRDPLDERAQDAVQLVHSLRDKGRVTLIADADIDGVAAAAILSRAFLRTRVRFHVQLTRRRDPSFFDEVFAAEPDLVVTADFGSTEVVRFEQAHTPAIICDHHHPQKDGHGPTLAHLNPHLVGEDGSRTASGAAVSWVLAKALLAAHDRDATDLAQFALLGAHGDRYHGAETSGGLHGRLLRALGRPRAGATTDTAGASEGPDVAPAATAAALERIVRWAPGPTLTSGPLAESLALGIDPFLARFGADPEAAAALLERMGLDPALPAAALDEAQRRTLASWLTTELLAGGAEPESMARLLEPTAVYPRYNDLDVATIGELIDSACREGAPVDGLIGLLGGDADREPLVARVSQYNDTIRQALVAATAGATGPPTKCGPATLFRVPDGAYAGPIADRLMAWTHHGRTPIIVGGPLDGRGFKVSLRARAPPRGKLGGGEVAHVRWRLDEVARRAARGAQGIGGGHALAAGAVVDGANADALLQRLGRELSKQGQGRVGATSEPAADAGAVDAEGSS